MGETRKMHLITDVYHGQDGMAVLYGPGELHEPGSLPEGIRYREVLADDDAVARAPRHAQPVAAPPPPEAEAPAKRGPGRPPKVAVTTGTEG